MGREGKVNWKRNFKRRVRSKYLGSDDSDEDYVLDNEVVVSDEDYLEEMENSLDEYASEETFGGSVEEDDEVEESDDGFRKVVNSQRQRGRRKKAGRKTSRKRKRIYFEEEDEEDDEDYVNDEGEEYVDDNDDDDGEFTPEEVDDLLDEDEDHMLKKNKKYNVQVGKRSMWNGGFVKGQRRTMKRKSRVSRNPSVLKCINHGRLKKEEGFELDDVDNTDFLENVPVNRKKRSMNCLKARRRTYVVYSDSDFVSSRSSDYEYTISEEEREQVKRGSKLFGNLKNSLRSSTSTKRMQENGVTCQQNNLGRKGKEKVKEIKEEVVKQVCGICLSEEDKRRSRGILDCCSHFFCFTCIAEWSKVESRCPLCKQRFKTITKNGRSTIGVDLRNVVIEVPERDQVYQPTEEEIRSVIDPYESVICSECHEGGDDGLMLLCDLCDSPAHTYCVGLGQQVPEDNWYCDGCRPVVLGSSSTQAEDQRMTGNNTFDRPPPLSNMVERSGTVIESSPRSAFSQVFGNMSSPRFLTGNIHTACPVSGVGAPTLSMRRQIHRHIQNIVSMNFMAGRMDGVSASNLHSELLNSRIYQDRETEIRNSSAQEIGLLQNMLLGERSLANNHSSTSIHDNGFLSLSLSQFRSQVVWNPTITLPNRSVNLASCPELQGTNALHVNEQLHQYGGRSSMASDGNFSLYGVREQNRFYALKEQLQSMVKAHLTNLSQDIDLGHDTYKDVARSSTHTILAACGLQHRRSEVQNVPLPSTCNHADRLAVGEMSMMKDFCTSCFDSFVIEVVKRILNARLSQWLSLCL